MIKEKHLNSSHTYGVSFGGNSFPGVFIVILNLVNNTSEVVVAYDTVTHNINRYSKNCMLIGYSSLHIFEFNLCTNVIFIINEKWDIERTKKRSEEKKIASCFWLPYFNMDDLCFTYVHNDLLFEKKKPPPVCLWERCFFQTKIQCMNNLSIRVSQKYFSWLRN